MDPDEKRLRLRARFEEVADLWCDRLAGMIDGEFGGRIEKHWAATVTIAQLSRSARG